MAAEQRVLKPDGYLDVPADSGTSNCSIKTNGDSEEESIETRSIVYHPNLNVILVFDSINQVKVLDVHSGAILQTYHLGNGKFAQCLLVIFVCLYVVSLCCGSLIQGGNPNKSCDYVSHCVYAHM